MVAFVKYRHTSVIKEPIFSVLPKLKMGKAIFEIKTFCKESGIEIKLDVEKSQKKFNNDNDKFLQVAQFKKGADRVVLKITGEITTKGVAVNEFTNNGKKSLSYSIGIRLEDSMETLLDSKIAEYLAALFPDFEFTTPIRDEILYVKLKPSQDKKSFGIVSNIKLDPKKIGDAPIEAGSAITVFCELNCYVNFRDEKAGAIFNVTEIEFDV